MRKKLKGKITCPSCGSKNFESYPKRKTVKILFATTQFYDVTLYHCFDCDMVGDFSMSGEEDKIIERLLKRCNRMAIKFMIESLEKYCKHSMPYIERVFNLSPGIMKRWKVGRFTDSDLALVKVIFIHSKIIEVIEEMEDQRRK